MLYDEYKNDAFISNMVDNAKKNLSKTNAIMSAAFIIAAVVNIIANLFFPDGANMITRIYIIVMSIVIMVISILTIKNSLKEQNNQLVRHLAVISTLLTIFSIVFTICLMIYEYNDASTQEKLYIDYAVFESYNARAYRFYYNYAYSIFQIFFSFLFFAQLYLRHFNDEFYQSKSEILSDKTIEGGEK